MRKIKVGIIQQANVADMRINLMNLAKSIEACATHGAQLVVLQELHNSLYFCQTENTQLFDLAEPIPGPSTGFYSELAAANNIVLVTSLFENALRVYIIIRLLFLNVTEALPGNIARCTFRTIRLIMKSSILPPEIWDLNLYRRLWGNWAFWFVGTSGIPKLLVLWR